MAVECESELTRGQTVCDVYGITGNPPNTSVAVELDTERLFELLYRSLASGQQPAPAYASALSRWPFGPSSTPACSRRAVRRASPPRLAEGTDQEAVDVGEGEGVPGLQVQFGVVQGLCRGHAVAGRYLGYGVRIRRSGSTCLGGSISARWGLRGGRPRRAVRSCPGPTACRREAPRRVLRTVRGPGWRASRPRSSRRGTGRRVHLRRSRPTARDPTSPPSPAPQGVCPCPSRPAAWRSGSGGCSWRGRGRPRREPVARPCCSGRWWPG